MGRGDGNEKWKIKMPKGGRWSVLLVHTLTLQLKY
jgi:hypothetical protein